MRGRIIGGESETNSIDLDMYSRISTDIFNLIYLKENEDK
mgnify:CR=1 FL=1